VGATVGSYYKGKLDMQSEFQQRDLKTEKMHSEILLQLKDIQDQLEWNEAAVEQVANEIPRAVGLHEAHMHPKEYMSNSSPTRVEVDLPEKPQSMSSGAK
jgi:hypothetical protein